MTAGHNEFSPEFRVTPWLPDLREAASLVGLAPAESLRLTKAEPQHPVHTFLKLPKINSAIGIMEIVAFSARWVGSLC